MNKTCVGCGGTLQNTAKDQPFYTPKDLSDDTPLYCMRCYRMRHYGEVMPSYIDHDDYPAILEQIAPRSAIVKVIDLFDVEGSIIPAIEKFAHSDSLHIVANKRDLLPKSANDTKLKHRVNTILSEYGINPKSVQLVSAVKGHGIDELIDMLATLDNDIYVVGASNTGKSTLINAMISATAGKRSDVITTFNVPGTTQNLIAIPFEAHTLYDTPGLIQRNHYNRLLDESLVRMIHPRGEIKPKTFQLNPNQTLFLGGLARLDFISGLPSSFTVYTSDKVYLHRTKLLNADDFFESHAGDILVPHVSSTMWMHQYSINTRDKTDIVLPGLGFVTISGRGVVRVHTPRDITPYQRGALIG